MKFKNSLFFFFVLAACMFSWLFSGISNDTCPDSLTKCKNECQTKANECAETAGQINRACENEVSDRYPEDPLGFCQDLELPLCDTKDCVRRNIINRDYFVKGCALELRRRLMSCAEDFNYCLISCEYEDCHCRRSNGSVQEDGPR